MAIVEIKIGDHIKKVIDKNAIDKNAIDKIFKIIDLKEIKGGNWHDGFTISIIATIELIDNFEKPETETEEFCIQYLNGMCQINNVYATLVD